MATNTISGVIDGTTITIPLTVNSNAAVAQQALNTLSSLIANGTLSFVNYTGSSTLPGGTTSEFAVIEQGTSTVPLAVFEIGGNTVSAVLDGAALQSLIVGTGFFDPTAATVVSGAAGAVIGNIAAGTDVFFNGGNNGFSELGLSGVGGPASGSPSATVWVSDNGTFDDSNGSTGINIGVVGAASTGANLFGQQLTVTNNGLGTTTINLSTDTTNSVDDGKVIVFSGSSTIATTVNAAGGATSLGAATGGYQFIGVGSGLSFINGNGSNVDMFFGSGTVFGGAGIDIDAENQGLFVGGTHNGTASGSFLFGSAVAGTTTLVGGGNNDLLAAVGAKTLMIAGQGNETLYAFATGATVQGIGVTTAIGGHSLPTTQTTGSATNMLGEVGGNIFQTGVGATNITAAQSGGGNTLQEGVAGTNSAVITSFLSGTDTISLTNPAGGKYTPESTGAPTSGQVEVAAGTSGGSVVTFGDGTTWTFNTVVQLTDFH